MAQKTTFEWWTYLIKGVILLTLAAILIARPEESVLSSILIIGLALLTNGVILIVTAVGGRKSSKNWTWKVAEGVLDILFAVLFLSKPEITALALPYMIGAWVMFYGIALFADSFGLLDGGFKGWWLQLLAGLAVMFLGYSIIFSPDGTAGAKLLWYLQIALIVTGIYNILKSIYVLRSAPK